MRSLFRSIFRRRPASHTRINDTERRQNVTQVRAMTGSMTAAALYACTMTSPTASGAVPDDAEAKAHHVKGGGFLNPWDSYKEFSAPGVMGKMIWYIPCSRPPQELCINCAVGRELMAPGKHQILPLLQFRWSRPPSSKAEQNPKLSEQRGWGRHNFLDIWQILETLCSW